MQNYIPLIHQYFAYFLHINVDQIDCALQTRRQRNEVKSSTSLFETGWSQHWNRLVLMKWCVNFLSCWFWLFCRMYSIIVKVSILVCLSLPGSSIILTIFCYKYRQQQTLGERAFLYLNIILSFCCRSSLISVCFCDLFCRAIRTGHQWYQRMFQNSKGVARTGWSLVGRDVSLSYNRLKQKYFATKKLGQQHIQSSGWCWFTDRHVNFEI